MVTVTPVGRQDHRLRGSVRDPACPPGWLVHPALRGGASVSASSWIEANADNPHRRPEFENLSDDGGTLLRKVTFTEDGTEAGHVLLQATETPRGWVVGQFTRKALRADDRTCGPCQSL